MGDYKSKPVSYSNQAERRLLRFALWDTWGRKCYWCDTPKVYLDVEIDHIVPKGLTDEQYEAARTGYGLPTGFNLHDPMNLAPICDPCNGGGRKGAKTYTGAAVVLDHLSKAAALREAVIQTVTDFREGSGVAKALLELASSDTSSSDVQKLFRAYFPAVANTAASVDLDLLSLPVYRELSTDYGFPVRIDLESSRSKDLWLLEGPLGCDLESALESPLGGLMRELAIEMESSLQSLSEYEPLDVGPPTPVFFDVRLTDLVLPHWPLAGEFELELLLRFDGNLTCSVSRQSDDGDERLDLQGDADVEGTVTLLGTWSIDDGLLLPSDVTVDALQMDPSLG